MKCHEAREFFSPYLDGELAATEINILEQHLDLCPDCRKELCRWQELSQALQGLAAPVTAPPDFSAAVTARVAARQQARPWQQHARQWAAAAAAVAVLAAGTLGYASRGLWQQLPLLATDPPGQQVAVEDPDSGINLPPLDNEPANEPGSPADPEPGNDNNPPGSESNQPGTAPGDSGNKPDPGNQDTPGSGEPGETPLQVAEGETYTPRTFLSDNKHQSTDTLLKLSVDDLAAAKAKVTDLAAGKGADLQVVADQNDGQDKRFIYQLGISKEKAGDLLEALSKAGTVTSRNDNTQDLTQQFSTTLERYQAKVAEANSATETEEKEQLLQEAKTLEQQLLTWEQEAKQQTIVLWLEVK